MASFVYQYAVMWVVFLAGIGVGLRTGELGFSGRRGARTAMLFAGMIGFMALQAAFTDWSRW